MQLIKRVSRWHHFPLILIIFLSLLPVYFYRFIYLDRYDFKYVESHFHHSQWEIPNSPWVIGDDGLYQFVGAELVKGRDPLTINAEAPPLGKYLIGFSISQFNNPYLIILVIYFLSLAGFYFLVANFFGRKIALTATFYLLSSPLFFFQLKTTTLDLFQIFWLIFHTMAVFFLSKTQTTGKKFLFSILSGITLGGFLGTKFGIFAFGIVLADIYLLYKSRRLSFFPLIIFSCFSVYLTLYTAHFLHGGTLVSWLKGQKWILNFFLAHDQPGVSPFFIFLTLFTGVWINGERAIEWTPLWPIFTLTFFLAIYRNLKKRLLASNQYIIYMLIFLTVAFIILAFNFFWTRYILVLLPFLLILLSEALAKKNILLKTCVFLIAVVFALHFLLPDWQTDRKEIEYAWGKSNYEDLYNYLTTPDRQKYSRQEFASMLANLDWEMNFPEKTVELTLNPPAIKIVYKTGFGNITHQNSAIFTTESSGYKIKWDWNLVLQNYSPEDKIYTQRETYQPDQNLIFATPNAIPPEEREATLYNLHFSTGISREKIRLLLFVLARNTADRPIPIGFPKKNNLPHEIYSTESYIKKNYGGEMFLIDRSGTKKVLVSRKLED